MRNLIKTEIFLWKNGGNLYKISALLCSNRGGCGGGNNRLLLFLGSLASLGNNNLGLELMGSGVGLASLGNNLGLLELIGYNNLFTIWLLVLLYTC